MTISMYKFKIFMVAPSHKLVKPMKIMKINKRVPNDNFLNRSQLLLNVPPDHTYCPVSVKMRPSNIDLLFSDSVNSYSRPWVVNELYSDHMPVRFNIEGTHFIDAPKRIPCYHLTNWR